MKSKCVSVVVLRPGSKKAEVLGRFYTVAEAEAFIAGKEKSDPEGVFRGDYGIDAPEGSS